MSFLFFNNIHTSSSIHLSLTFQLPGLYGSVSHLRTWLEASHQLGNSFCIAPWPVITRISFSLSSHFSYANAINTLQASCTVLPCRSIVFIFRPFKFKEADFFFAFHVYT